MKRLFTLIFTVLMIFSFHGKTFAQDHCGFDEAMMRAMKANPQYAKDIAKADSLWAIHQSDLMHTSRRLTIQGGDTIYEIPTVIHVLTTGGAIGTIYNPADSVLENWIDYLNDVYAGTYAGYPQAGSGGVALPVKFVLAKRSPSCDSTNGIERINLNGNNTYVNYGIRSSTSNGLTTTQVSAYQWPTDAYYNMYVVNKIDGEDGNCNNCTYTAGFAYLGLSTNIPPDGAYMLAHTAQAGNITLPHEIGHALGLYHVFEGTTTTACPPNTGNCNNDNDKVCDTDPSGVLLGTCPAGTATNPCTSMSYGSNGVQHNFMNYSQCQNHFTQGQADRMMMMLQTYRYKLITSNGALPPAPAVGNVPIAANCQPASMSNTSVDYNIGPSNVFLDSIQYYSNGYLVSSSNDNSFYYDHTQECAFPTHTSLIAGDTYHLSVSTQTNAQYVKAFIDYNNDGTFSAATETVMSVNSSVGDTTYTVSVVPPATATTNTPLRMRVIADFNNPSITPCGNLDYGQAEDFSVTILPNTPLNLGLTNFSGNAVADNQAVLSWTVNPEAEPINAFELQRSTNGRNFTTIAFINRQTDLSDYHYTDFVNTNQSDYYYRLKLISNATTPVYSKVVAINFSNPAQQIKVYPNPVTNQLWVKSQNALSAINIYDALGRNVLHQSISGIKTEQSIDMSHLPSGNYLIQAVDYAGRQMKQKITKK